MLLLYEFISTDEQIAKLVQSPYAAAIVLSIVGLMMGFTGGWVSRTKLFAKIVGWLKDF